MRHLLIALLMTFATQAGAFGEIVCEVKTNNVTSISDGQPKIFTGYKDKFEVGDNIELDILYYKYSENLNFTFIDRVLTNILLTTYRLVPENSMVVGNDVFTSDDTRLLSTFGRELIRLFDSQSKLVLRRYYKSDYAGYFVQTNPLSMSVQVPTFDCRTKVDVVDEIMEKFGK